MTKSSVALPPVTATESASCRPQPNIDNTLKNVWTVPALRVRKQHEHSSLNSLNYGLQPQYKWTSGPAAKRPGRRATSNRAKSSAPKMPDLPPKYDPTGVSHQSAEEINDPLIADHRNIPIPSIGYSVAIAQSRA